MSGPTGTVVPHRRIGLRLRLGKGWASVPVATLDSVRLRLRPRPAGTVVPQRCLLVQVDDAGALVSLPLQPSLPLPQPRPRARSRSLVPTLVPSPSPVSLVFVD